MTGVSTIRCILSKFYIKPQQRIRHRLGHSVVSYRNSTSNHNYACVRRFRHKVVSYRNSTSNHNFTPRVDYSQGLYLIEILHQTTTKDLLGAGGSRLYLIEILHQTTTVPASSTLLFSCILSKFYIKPQQQLRRRFVDGSCILSKFYIKPQQTI